MFRFFGEYDRSNTRFSQFDRQIIRSKLGAMGGHRIKDDVSILVMRVEKKK